MARTLHSFRCADPLWEAITAHADDAGISANEAMEKLLEERLGLSPSPVTSDVKSDVIAGIQARLQAIEKVIAGSDITLIASPIAGPIADLIAVNTSDWLTTGEARTAMQQRHGYKASPNTFRRQLRASQEQRAITPELINGGVTELDFETRAVANPKSNAVRWIRVS
jgi:hypothetical protein